MPRQRVAQVSSSDQFSGYRPTSHVVKMAASKGIPLAHVLEAANNPATTYDVSRYPGQKRHIRGSVAAVVDPSTMSIITAYQNRTETAMRPDQASDPEARKHFGCR